MIIPISFLHDGRRYDGTFKTVSGGGSSSLFFLMIDNFFYGQLFYTSFGWQFASNKDHFKHMNDFFGSYISAWLDSNTQHTHPTPLQIVCIHYFFTSCGSIPGIVVSLTCADESMSSGCRFQIASGWDHLIQEFKHRDHGGVSKRPRSFYVLNIFSIFFPLASSSISLSK